MSLVQNILTYCHSLKTALREYSQLPETEQKQVWRDLSGTEAKGRLFIRGKEPSAFAREFEPPSLIDESLLKLDLELLRMNFHRKQAYNKALKSNREYVLDKKFRLKFLRAEKFDAALAASRLVLHFEEKLELFGEDLLGREILLSDLDEDDLDTLNMGYLQVLQQPDSNNRKVLFYYRAISDCYKRRENILKVLWYVSNVISEDEDVQKLGVVNVVYNVGGYVDQSFDYEKSRRVSRIFRAIPLRFASFFVCLDEGAWMTVVDAFSFMISKYLRIRLRVILGDHVESQEKLKAVGVPSSVLPIDNTKNKLLLDAHKKWIESRREKEDQKYAAPDLDTEPFSAESVHFVDDAGDKDSNEAEDEKPGSQKLLVASEKSSSDSSVSHHQVVG